MSGERSEADATAADASRRFHRLQTVDETREVYRLMPWWHPWRWVALAWLRWHRRSIERSA